MSRIELEDRTFWFVNLTNGLEAIWQLNLERYEFVRIRSTDVEFGRWREIIDGLDANFLMRLALGQRCVVVDASKNEESFAVAGGLPWIRYVLGRCWYGDFRRRAPYAATYAQLPKETLEKLFYFRRFTRKGGSVKLESRMVQTTNDDKKRYWAMLVGGDPDRTRHVVEN